MSPQETVAVTTRIRHWLQAHLPWVKVPDPVRTHVVALVRAADALDASGEYKRHVVYAQLIKAHPTVPKRRLAWLIEDVLLQAERW